MFPPTLQPPAAILIPEIISAQIYNTLFFLKPLHLFSINLPNIPWIVEKGREFQKNMYFCFIDYAKAFDCGSQ